MAVILSEESLPREVKARVNMRRVTWSIQEPVLERFAICCPYAGALHQWALEFWDPVCYEQLGTAVAYLHTLQTKGRFSSEGRKRVKVWGNGALVQIGSGPVQLAALDDVNVSRVAVVRADSRVLEFRRGPEHRLVQAFTFVRAFVCVIDGRPIRAFFSEADEPQWVHLLLSTTPEGAMLQFNKMFEDDAGVQIKEFSGSELLDIISHADVIGINGEDYPINDLGRVGLHGGSAIKLKTPKGAELASELLLALAHATA